MPGIPFARRNAPSGAFFLAGLPGPQQSITYYTNNFLQELSPGGCVLHGTTTTLPAIMTSKNLLPGLIALACALPVLAEDAPVSQAAPQTTPPSQVTGMADRCTNCTSATWGFKSPRNFLKWLDVFSDPGIYLEFGRRAMDPQYLVSSLDSFLDPGTPRNFLEWTNPEIYTRWGESLAQPEYYTAVNSILFDPGRMMRWIMLPLDGKSWELAGTAINPATWLKWLNAPLDPKTQALFARATNPETARLWLEALGDPKNAPWLYPKTRVQAAEQAEAPPMAQTERPMLTPSPQNSDAGPEPRPETHVEAPGIKPVQVHTAEAPAGDGLESWPWM